jgi:Mlc titration factor MtfA (ptsG expression regulator)
MNLSPALVAFCLVLTGVIILLRARWKKRKTLRENLKKEFPASWRAILEKRVLFYSRLNTNDKNLFEKRIRLFIATKIIKGVDTEIDDSIKLMVASSAVIPTFAFPGYNYPNVHTVLIYPNSFDDKFQTQRYKGHKENISGMVQSSFSNSTMILSRQELVRAFDGLPHKENVGVHEFVHLLDKDDGSIDGIPEMLVTHAFVGPWLHEIKNEIKKIEAGSSDINPYALTSNAEFLAVVSEYFFDNPEKFHKRHPELYNFLSTIFNRDKAEK